MNQEKNRVVHIALTNYHYIEYIMTASERIGKTDTLNFLKPSLDIPVCIAA